MRAIIITTPGGPEALELREVADPPEPVADQVLVRVFASALNRADVLQRRGKYPAPPNAPRDIPGLEFAGEVVQVGPQVNQWRLNDRVFGICGGGAYAEFVTVPANHLARIPKNLSWVEAAAIPEVFITAHDALFTQARLQPGETVVVHAAGSGVGTAALQLIRSAGARSFGTSRSADKLERAAEFGLDESMVIKDEPRLMIEKVKAWTSGVGADVVLDLVGAAYFGASLMSMGDRGRMILVGSTSGTKASLDYGLMMSRRLTVRGTVLRARSLEEKATATRLFAQHVVPLLASGAVRPVIDRTYKLDEVRQAHERMESNESFGKIVLQVMSP